MNKIEIKQQVEEGLKELDELYRLEEIERKADLKLRIFHPFKWRKKHKDDPVWLRCKNLVSLGFVSRR